MRQQIDHMRRQVDYHLAHARAAAAAASTPGARSSVRASAEGLARTLLRLHAGRDLAIAIECPEAHTVAVQREDLDEMLGNLLDNACTWARTHVTLSSTQGQDHVVVFIDDDGPGLVEPRLGCDTARDQGRRTDTRQWPRPGHRTGPRGAVWRLGCAGPLGIRRLPGGAAPAMKTFVRFVPS
jgi:signal transduction histidine kinase